MGKTSATVKNRYADKSYDRVQIKKGLKEDIKAHIKYTGESMIDFINRAISETIERDEMTPGFLHGVASDTSDND